MFIFVKLNYWKSITLVLLLKVRYHLGTGSKKIPTLPTWFPHLFPSACWDRLRTARGKIKQKKLHLLLFPRFLPVCVVTGLRLLHVSDSSVDRHLLQAPSQPHPALLRMGASHHCHGHQQVCVCVCNCVCVFSLQRGKNSYSASATASVWFAWWLIP